jgi:hypothetical protein
MPVLSRVLDDGLNAAERKKQRKYSGIENARMRLDAGASHHPQNSRRNMLTSRAIARHRPLKMPRSALMVRRSGWVLKS